MESSISVVDLVLNAIWQFGGIIYGGFVRDYIVRGALSPSDKSFSDIDIFFESSDNYGQFVKFLGRFGNLKVLPRELSSRSDSSSIKYRFFNIELDIVTGKSLAHVSALHPMFDIEGLYMTSQKNMSVCRTFNASIGDIIGQIVHKRAQFVMKIPTTSMECISSGGIFHYSGKGTILFTDKGMKRIFKLHKRGWDLKFPEGIEKFVPEEHKMSFIAWYYPSIDHPDYMSKPEDRAAHENNSSDGDDAVLV